MNVKCTLVHAKVHFFLNFYFVIGKQIKMYVCLGIRSEIIIFAQTCLLDEHEKVELTTGCTLPKVQHERR